MELVDIKDIKNAFMKKTELDEVTIQTVIDNLPRFDNYVEIPCKVGDVIYKICPVSQYLEIGDKWDGKIISCDCQRCAYGGTGACWDIGYQKDARNIIKDVAVKNEEWIVKRKNLFGKVYFLSKNEAEQYIKNCK